MKHLTHVQVWDRRPHYGIQVRSWYPIFDDIGVDAGNFSIEWFETIEEADAYIETLGVSICGITFQTQTKPRVFGYDRDGRLVPLDTHLVKPE
jgi:hypothetical protein